MIPRLLLTHDFRNVVVLSGAGVSVASGLRPFRVPGGLWTDIEEVTPLQAADMATRPLAVWKFFRKMYDSVAYHLKKVFEDSELQEDAVVRNFRITAADGKSYDTKHDRLSAIIAVEYKVNSERAVQFRKWATRVVSEFTVKGFAMDDERLKRGGTILSERYFEEQLQRYPKA